MREKILAIRSLALPFLILIAGSCALIFSTFSKWNAALNDRQLRSAEHLQSVGHQTAQLLSEFLIDIQRSIAFNDDAVAALARLNLQAVPANRTNPLDMQPGEVEVLKVGKLARFEGRLSSGQFVKALVLGLRVFPSGGDPAVVLLGAHKSALLVAFSFDYRIVIVALSPSVLRKHFEGSNLFTQSQNVSNVDSQDSERTALEWALVALPSAWAVQNTETNEFEFVDRGGLDTFNAPSEKKQIAHLAIIPDQVQSLAQESGIFSGQRMMGSSGAGGVNLRLILSQKVALSLQEAGVLIFQEGVVLLSCMVVFSVLLLYQRRSLILLLQKSKAWIEALPFFTPVATEFLSPPHHFAALLADQMKHTEFLVQSWRRDVIFLRTVLTDVIAERREEFVLEEKKEAVGKFEEISWEKSPGTGYEVFVSKILGPDASLIFCFSVRDPDDMVGLALTHVQLQKIRGVLAKGVQTSRGVSTSESATDPESVKTSLLEWLEKTVAENGLDKMVPSDLKQVCLIYVLIQGPQLVVRQFLPAGGYEFKSLLNVHTLNLNDVRLLTFRTPAIVNTDFEDHTDSAQPLGTAL